MLTLGQMIRATPKKTWKSARGIQVKVVASKFGQSPEKTPYYEAMIKAKSTLGATPRPLKKTEIHNVIIRQYGTNVAELAAGGVRTTHKTWVHCSCEHFLFTCEYALAKYGSSSIISSNGKPPVITNPRLLPVVCKHIVAVTAIHPKLNLPVLPENIVDPAKLEVMEADRVPTKTEKKLLDILGEDED
jgi:hypothetical protein